MGLEDTVASNRESAKDIQAQSLMDLFSLKGRTILVTGEYAASSTDCLATLKNISRS